MSISLSSSAAPDDAGFATSPEAIQACLASLAAEAFDSGHFRAAQVLAHAAALLRQPDLWNGVRRRG